MNAETSLTINKIVLEWNAETATELLKKFQKHKDWEAAHDEADKVICALLESLGCRSVADEFAKLKGLKP